MSAEEIIRTHFPYLLAKRYEAVQLEDDPQLRIIRMIELFEETVRYLALIGLAEYNQMSVSDEKVERDRRNLSRPSLGHWLDLLISLSSVLNSPEYKFQIPPLNQIYSNDAIYHAAEQLHHITGIELPKKVRLEHFLKSFVVFRNKKFAHGSLSSWEAKQVISPLEDSLNQWLEALTILYQYCLLYIERVEWTGDYFLCTGHNLNNGTSIFRINLERDEKIHPRRVYLGEDNNANQSMVSLYPFFEYKKEFTLIYIFNELSNKGYRVLRCFYAQSPDFINLELEADRSHILGAYTESEESEFYLEEEYK